MNTAKNFKTSKRKSILRHFQSAEYCVHLCLNRIWPFLTGVNDSSKGGGFCSHHDWKSARHIHQGVWLAICLHFLSPSPSPPSSEQSLKTSVASLPHILGSEEWSCVCQPMRSRRNFAWLFFFCIFFSYYRFWSQFSLPHLLLDPPHLPAHLMPCLLFLSP